ncbi:hypothetical protein OpiT1DRAFT_02702 [Opitutaceae bacterium TAV1]|nr:hypothetical protein OpiT1DRAFT_02702 [Opitutaceae bacterium TAV1]
MSTNTANRHSINFAYRFAAREPAFDAYPWKSRNGGGLPWEGFEKAAWLHHTTGTPLTWMVDTVALQQAGRRLRQFADVFGDDVVLWLDVFARQPFYEQLGITQRTFGLRNYTRDELVTLIRGSRDLAADVLGRDVRIGAGFWWNADVLHAARAAGLDALWGLCWDQKGIDGATHRGSPWFPYYASPDDFKAPVRSREDGLLLLPWYRADLGNAFLYDDHPPFTTHTGELTRWNSTWPANYVRALLGQGADEAKRSPFAFTEFFTGCECLDTSGIFHDEEMCPSSEIWANQKACILGGMAAEFGNVVQLHAFTDWHLANRPETTRHELYWRDPFGKLPDLRFAAGTDALTVTCPGPRSGDAGARDDVLVARQSYASGCLGEASPGFLDRASARNALAPDACLPAVLARRLAMKMGREENLLVAGVACEC